MSKDTMLAVVSGVEFETPSIEGIVAAAAKQMLRTALEAEVRTYVESMRDQRTPDGQVAVVRNGYHVQRDIAYCGGSLEVQVPRTRDRSGAAQNFVSTIVPPYLRRSLKLDEAIPLLYLKGISTGEMLPALQALLGDKMNGISASTVSRLKASWEQEHKQWSKRDLSGKSYCYVWVDGIYTSVRFGENRLCTLVAIGADEKGRKELIAVESGYRESCESWSTLLRQLRDRGLVAPALFIGDGALGFWKAAREVYPQSRCQRCWVHKTANILDKLPKAMQPKAKGLLHEVYLASSKKAARSAAQHFIVTFKDKYPKCTECLSQDLELLLTFYDYPAAHWQHIRSTNIIESTFATVRLRTQKTRGHGTEKSTMAMVFKLLEAASKRWRRLRGYKLIPMVVKGVTFVNGELKKAA